MQDMRWQRRGQRVQHLDAPSPESLKAPAELYASQGRNSHGGQMLLACCQQRSCFQELTRSLPGGAVVPSALRDEPVLPARCSSEGWRVAYLELMSSRARRRCSSPLVRENSMLIIWPRSVLSNWVPTRLSAVFHRKGNSCRYYLRRSLVLWC